MCCIKLHQHGSTAFLARLLRSPSWLKMMQTALAWLLVYTLKDEVPLAGDMLIISENQFTLYMQYML